MDYKMKSNLKNLVDVLKKKSKKEYSNIIKMAEEYLEEPDVFIDISELECLVNPKKCKEVDTSFGINFKN